MNRTEREVILINLIDSLGEKGSWSGETHVQKATYLLEELLATEAGFTYVLYRHGPFSFELRDEVNRLVLDGLLLLQPRPPYGPTLAPSDEGLELSDRFPGTTERYRRQIEFVSESIGPADVFELERLATALFLVRQDPDASDERVSSQLVALKPHIDLALARTAVERIRTLDREATKLRAA